MRRRQGRERESEIRKRRRKTATSIESPKQPTISSPFITPSNDVDSWESGFFPPSHPNLFSPLSYRQDLSTSIDLSESTTASDSIEADADTGLTQVPDIYLEDEESYPSGPNFDGVGGTFDSHHTNPDSTWSMINTVATSRAQIGTDLPASNFPKDNEESLTSHWRPGSVSHRPRSSSLGSGTALELSLASQNLVENAARSFMTRNLLRIYHDSMENALSCWLTERNCPYSGIIGPSNRGMKPHLQKPMVSEWGPNWSNRICTRVCRLDRAYSTIRGRGVTTTEEQAASRALHTVIMAFAAQWAQAGERSAKGFPSYRTTQSAREQTYAISDQFDGFGTPGADQDNLSFSSSDEFGRSIQETLWNQASRALHDSAGIESFRVAFAHIIFSLTQRPLSITRHAEAMDVRRRYFSQREFREAGDGESPSTSSIPSSSAHCETASGLAELHEVIDSDEAPRFLETGLRQLFSHRHKLEILQRRRAAEPKTDLLSADDRETFNLLFWLGIMFDTLTAAMHQRPVVVSDEDSSVMPEETSQSGLEEKEIDLDGWDQVSDHTSWNKHDQNLWGDLFLHKRDSGHWRDIARWPCSYGEAAATLSDAAPVKVLLFRRVTRLQTLVYRRAGPEALEDTIQDTLRLYRYWNQTYGRFMLNCVAHHDSLPPRIQSWYVLLSGHWQLAAILLADTIEGIDKREIGLKSQRELRQSSHLVSTLRKQSAHAISDLARCSLHGEDQSFSKAREFHDALNDGAFLTEPWTAVLIRSFGRAGYILLDEIPTSAQEHGKAHRAQADGVDEAKRKCGFCIDALCCLARKSDMALLAARALTNSLEERLREHTLNQVVSELSAQNGTFNLAYFSDFQTPFVCPLSG
jgi:hypothetical protein